MKIRVTRTEIWEYEPDLTEEFYVSKECDSIYTAIQADKLYYEKTGEINEITSIDPYTSTKWEVIDG